MRPAQVVEALCTAITERDATGVRSVLDDQVVYLNVGMAPAVGVDAALESVTAQWAMFPDQFDFAISHIASAGAVVLTERVDTVGMPGAVAPVPVMGAFEVRAGKVVSWRDYFDPALVGRMLGGEDVTAVVP